MKAKLTKKNIMILAGAGLSLYASNAFAVVGAAGCGLGSIVFKEEVWWKQVLAATTNGTFGNQTFAISSGTSNCPKGTSAQVQKQKDYVAANLTSLQREVAQGNGETVNGFASVLGCPTSSYHDFGTYAQSSYKAIFNSNDPSVIVMNIKGELTKNSNLYNSCNIGSI